MPTPANLRLSISLMLSMGEEVEEEKEEALFENDGLDCGQSEWENDEDASRLQQPCISIKLKTNCDGQVIFVTTRHASTYGDSEVNLGAKGIGAELLAIVAEDVCSAVDYLALLDPVDTDEEDLTAVFEMFADTTHEGSPLEELRFQGDIPLADAVRAITILPDLKNLTLVLTPEMVAGWIDENPLSFLSGSSTLPFLISIKSRAVTRVCSTLRDSRHDA